MWSRLTWRRSGTYCRNRCRRCRPPPRRDRKSTRLNSSHLVISYAVFCLKKTIHGATLPAPAFDRFVLRTEGWVAGVRLAALRLAVTACPAAVETGQALCQDAVDASPMNA